MRVSFSYNEINWQFLIFLVLISQGFMPLKLVGILFIFLMQPNAILKFYRFNAFYLFIGLFHFVYGLVLFFTTSFSYFPNYLLTLFFWFISYFCLAQIIYYINNENYESIQKTVDVFFIFNVVVVIYQLLMLMIDYKSVNPYLITNSAGDFIKSIYSNSSINLMVMSFFTLMYFTQKRIIWGLLSLVILFMTTYMSGLVLFVLGLCVGLFILTKIKLKYRILLLLLAPILYLTFRYISPSNITYAERYILRIFSNENLPFKLKSFVETVSYWLSSVKTFLFGAGGGNFSSRAAFICSGDYVNWYPDSLKYISYDFRLNHYAIWTYDFNNPWDNRNNTANQPFSFYNQILGEYGLIGVTLFFLFYIFYILKIWKKLSFTKYAFIILMTYFVLDYWFEYFSIIIIFETLLCLDLKKNKYDNGQV